MLAINDHIYPLRRLIKGQIISNALTMRSLFTIYSKCVAFLYIYIKDIRMMKLTASISP